MTPHHHSATVLTYGLKDSRFKDSKIQWFSFVPWTGIDLEFDAQCCIVYLQDHFEHDASALIGPLMTCIFVFTQLDETAHYFGPFALGTPKYPRVCLSAS